MTEVAQTMAEASLAEKATVFLEYCSALRYTYTVTGTTVTDTIPCGRVY